MHEIEWTDQKISNLWGFYANNPSYQTQYFSYHSGRDIIRYAARYIKPSGIYKVLDFGCGPGYLIKHITDIYRDAKVSGFDFSEDSIRQARQRLGACKQFEKALCAQKLPLPFDKDVFDLVTCVEVVEHLTDNQLNINLNEINRILKPGGYILITTRFDEELGANKTICPECACVFHRWQHIRSWNETLLESVLKKSGFKTVACVALNSFESHGRALLKKALRFFFNRNIKSSPQFLIYIGRK